MTKYIDAERLKAEIERRRLSNRYIDTEDYENELLEIIDSLQQEQPNRDFEKEGSRYFSEILVRDEGDRSFSITYCFKVNFDTIARHFYELGLNARKEE